MARRTSVRRRRVAKLVAISLLASCALMRVAVADAPPYDLDRVRGIEAFPQDPHLREQLARDGFAVGPERLSSLHWMYKHPSTGAILGRSLPPFITVDSAFRTYHVLLEEAIAQYERRRAGEIAGLLRSLLDAVSAVRVDGSEGDAAKTRLIAWLTVGLALSDDLPAADRANGAGWRLVRRELRRIEAGVPTRCTVLSTRRDIDYGALEPSGLYASSEELAGLWRTVRWFGVTQFSLEDDDDLRALLLLVVAVAKKPQVLEEIASCSRLEDEVLGPPDDLTLAEALRAGEQVIAP